MAPQLPVDTTISDAIVRNFQAGQQRQADAAKQKLEQGKLDFQIKEFKAKSDRDARMDAITHTIRKIEGEEKLKLNFQKYGVAAPGWDVTNITETEYGNIATLTPQDPESFLGPFDAAFPGYLIELEAAATERKNEQAFDLSKRTADMEWGYQQLELKMANSFALEQIEHEPTEELLLMWAEDPEHSNHEIAKRVVARMKEDRISPNLAQDILTAHQYVRAFFAGTMPAQLINRGIRTKAVAIAAGYIVEQGGDLQKQISDELAVLQWIKTLNNAQFVNLRASVNLLQRQIPVLRRVFDNWVALAEPGDWALLNRFKMGAASAFESDSPKGRAAQLLKSQVATMVAALASIYRGGLSSTDESLKLAHEDLDAVWAELTMEGSIQILEEDLEMRLRSIISTGPAGLYDAQSDLLPPGVKPITFEPEEPEESEEEGLFDWLFPGTGTGFVGRPQLPGGN